MDWDADISAGSKIDRRDNYRVDSFLDADVGSVDDEEVEVEVVDKVGYGGFAH